MKNELTGKVIAITGASSGIGEVTARRLAEDGATVVLGARRLERLEALATQITNAGGKVAFVRTDVTRRDDLTNLIDVALERYGKLDVLVNNAGIAPISLLEEGRVAEWDAMIDVNIKGLLYGIAAALPVFRRQAYGHFINMASTAGLITTPTMAVYSATKFAVRAISEGLRQEVGANLRVTIITPGFVQTSLADSMTDPAVKAQILSRMNELAIPPDAIARAIAYAIEQPMEVDVNEIIIRPRPSLSVSFLIIKGIRYLREKGLPTSSAWST